MKRVIFITLLLSFIGSSVFAQSDEELSSTGSVYSKIGIGYPVNIGNTAAQSMGLLGVSYNETNVGSFSNPAHWGSTVYGLGTGGLGLNSFNASTSTSNARNVNFSVNQFQLQFPLIRGELGLSGSFAPLTEFNFRTFEEYTSIIGEGAGQDTLNYGIQNRGSGGVNRAELGIGWRINSNISVGYAASVVFLSMDDAFTATFAEAQYRPTNFAVESSGIGFGNRVGIHTRLPGVFRTDDQLGIGATVSLPVKIDAERKQTGTISNGAITLTEELPNSEGTIRMPMKIAGGVSYSPTNLLMFAAEGLYQGWSNYENDFKPDQDAIFTDRYKMGLGMQYFPYVTGSNKFLSSFKYRLGASYDTGHIKLEGEQINTLMFSFGLGIRSPNSNSSIDISFEYGLRGTESQTLVKEQIWGVRLSLNLAEVMFFRPRLQ